MVKGKAAKEALKQLGQTKFAKGAGIAGGAKLGEEAVSNPYAQAALGAVEGAALGSALGPLGAAGGAVAGGLLGFVLADGERIIPIDMIAIPAYQYGAMLQGREPTFQIFIKEGEMIAPVLATDYMESVAVVDMMDVVATKPRKKSKWHKYMGQKKNQIKFKSGKRKGQLDLKKMGKAFRNGGKK